MKGSEEVEWTRGRHDRQPTEFIALSTRREKKRGGGGEGRLAGEREGGRAGLSGGLNAENAMNL